MTLTGSTVSGNAAVQDGGGIVDSSTGMLTLRHSVISGNTAVEGNDGIIGNGIVNGAAPALNESAVSGNPATAGNGFSANDGQRVTLGSAGNEPFDAGGIGNDGDALAIIDGASSIYSAVAADGGATATILNSAVGGPGNIDGGKPGLPYGIVSAGPASFSQDSAGVGNEGSSEDSDAPSPIAGSRSADTGACLPQFNRRCEQRCGNERRDFSGGDRRRKLRDAHPAHCLRFSCRKPTRREGPAPERRASRRRASRLGGVLGNERRRRPAGAGRCSGPRPRIRPANGFARGMDNGRDCHSALAVASESRPLSRRTVAAA